MKHEKIFNSWGEKLYVESYEEFMDIDQNLLSGLIRQRNLVLIKGLSPNLTDEEFYALGKKFGKVWVQEDYRKTFISRGGDSTVDRTTKTPVSYFQTNNTMFKDNYMAYHADMAHINDMSYPGRALYMASNSEDGSGDTTWLNLELGWQQLTQEERDRYSDYEVVFQDFYAPGTRMEKLPFTKINPNTGMISPRINCYAYPNEKRAWINHIVKGGVELTFVQTDQLITELYALLETKQDTLYTHTWTNGDIIVYDNWFNVHKKEKVNGKRLLKRLTFNF